MAVQTGIPEIDGPDWLSGFFSNLFGEKAAATAFQQVSLATIRDDMTEMDERICALTAEANELAIQQRDIINQHRDLVARRDICVHRREKLIAAAKAIAGIEV